MIDIFYCALWQFQRLLEAIVWKLESIKNQRQIRMDLRRLATRGGTK